MIYNVMGQTIRTFHESQPAGAHSLTWDGRNETCEMVASGVYLYRIRAGQLSAARKMIVLH